MLGALGKQVEQYLPGAKMQVAKLADKAKVRGGKKKRLGAALRCAAAFRCCFPLLRSAAVVGPRTHAAAFLCSCIGRLPLDVVCTPEPGHAKQHAAAVVAAGGVAVS